MSRVQGPLLFQTDLLLYNYIFQEYVYGFTQILIRFRFRGDTPMLH